MQTHSDNDGLHNEFMDRLKRRALAMTKNKESGITAGKEGEMELMSWKHGKICVKHLPDDEQGILRISLGGGPTPVPMDYCVIRGSVGQCIELLERAIAALRASP